MVSAFGLMKVAAVIGAFSDSTYTQREIQLHEGDKLLLFTDGVTEARDASGEEFGEQRLQECLRSYRGSNAAELRTLHSQRSHSSSAPTISTTTPR